MSSILGIRITRDRPRRTITLDQSGYIKKFLKKFDLEECRSVTTPIDGYTALTPADPSEERINQLEYQQRLGSLMYAMTGTRPDIAFAVGKLSQYSHDPANRLKMHRI